jgi:hypothetical protein
LLPFASLNVLYGWMDHALDVVNMNGRVGMTPAALRSPFQISVASPFRLVLRSCRRTGIPELIGGSDCPLVSRREQAR